MSVDILGTNCDQCVSMVQCCFTSTETVRLIRTESPGRPPRLSHCSLTLKTAVSLFYTMSSDRTRAATSLTPLTRLVGWHTLTPSLPQPVKCSDAPSGLISSGPIAHLLSMLCVLMTILSHAGATKKAERLKAFRFRTCHMPSWQ